MNKKLTLLLDETVINRAKDYAKKRNETLSGMVEKYFIFITKKNAEKASINTSREIEDITGIIALPDNYDIKEEYRRHRSGKALGE